MPRLHHLLTSAVLAVAACAAHAAPYSSLIVFGDSLSDPGNAAALTATASGGSFFPGTPSGTFSNGPTAAQYLAASYGAPVVPGYPNPVGATNFAVGGARTGAGNFNFQTNSPNGLAAYPALATTGIAQQIDRYGANNSLSPLDAATTLFLLWGGPNDIFLGLALQQLGVPVDFGALIGAAVTNLSNDIGALAALGARNILVPNMPDLGLTPLGIASGPVFGATLTGLSDLFNAGLDAAIGFERTVLAPAGVNLYEFDTTQFLRDVASAPPAGLTNTSQACIDSLAALASNCAGYVFFNGVHLTTYGHFLLAQQFEAAAALVPEPATPALVAVAALAMAASGRRRGRVDAEATA